MLQQWIVLAHIVAGSMLIAGNAAALYSTARARREGTPAAILALMLVHHKAIMTLVVPGAIVVLASGLWLANHVGYPLDSLWLTLSFAAWVAAFGLGLWPLLPSEARAIKEANRQVDANEPAPSEALTRAVGVGNPTIWVTEHIQLYLMLGFLYLMVFKPS